jgi:hypothetical protein
MVKEDGDGKCNREGEWASGVLDKHGGVVKIRRSR